MPLVGLPLAVMVALVALLLAYTVTLMLRPLLLKLTEAPYIGGWLADRVEGVEHAIVAALMAFVHAGEAGIIALLHGPAQAVAGYADDLLGFADAVADSVAHLVSVKVPALIHAAVHPVSLVAHQALALAESAGTGAGKEVGRLDRRIDHLAGLLASEAVKPIRHFLHGVWPDAAAKLEAAFHAATVTLPHDVTVARDHADEALHQLGGVAAEISHAVDAAVGTVPADVLAAERAVAAELPGLAGLDLPDVEDLLRRLPWETLGGLLAAVPLLRILTQTIAAETGLDRAECRGKVKGICGTNPAAWLHLLEGLALVGGIASIEELIALGVKAIGKVEPIIEDIAA